MESHPALDAVFLPVQPPSTFEETVERLGTAIRLGLLAPGSKLPSERELARKLKISRSTLRQALTTLVQSGHLVALRGRKGGTFVAEQPPLTDRLDDPLDRDAWAALDYRVAIETGCVLLASERAQPEGLDRLEALVEKMAGEVDDFEEYRRTDVRFHIGIAEAASSSRLVGAMTDVQGQMSDLIALIAHPPEVLASSNEQHGRVVKALRKGDGPRAVGVMREHIEGTEHILAGLLPAPARLAKV
jgi:DNA-binding FadR family transcriptional regulator